MDSSVTSAQPAAPEDGPTVPWPRIERFVGQLTHDIRNGLNALELQLTYLGEISTDPEAVDEVKRLRASLLNITRQLQTLKIQTGPATAHPLDYPLTELCEDLRERFERAHPEAMGRVAWDLPASDAAVRVDPELTLAALLELLANALRFGAAASKTIFAAHADPASGQATISLRETKGEGSSPVDTRDWGAKPLESTHRGSYGLGLFRVRTILQAQGSDLRAAYDPARRSLLTTVAFPLAPALDSAA